MRAFGFLHSPPHDWGISRMPEGWQSLFEVLAGDDTVLLHALSSPCPDVEVLTSGLYSFGPHREGCARPQGQGSVTGGMSWMSFQGSSKVFAIHDVQYCAPQGPSAGRPRRARPDQGCRDVIVTKCGPQPSDSPLPGPHHPSLSEASRILGAVNRAKGSGRERDPGRHNPSTG